MVSPEKSKTLPVENDTPKLVDVARKANAPWQPRKKFAYAPDGPDRAPQKLAYTVKDLVRLGLAGKSTIWSWIASGLLPAVRLGGRTVILHADLNHFLATRPAARPNINREG